MKFYNTLGRQLQEFKPQNPPKVTFYHCGPTVYWVQHLGNMRAMVMADLVRRTLEYVGYEVEMVRNYTDVGHMTSDEDEGEDRMEIATKREKLSPEQIAKKYIDIFEKDISRLNTEDFEHKVRATAFIKEMQDMVQTLLDKGYAYITPLAVYFDVSKKEDYTKLSGQILEKNRAKAGSGSVYDEYKRNPQDFALWFFKTGEHKNAIQTWKSPFESPDPSVKDGEGFPGWHIECSAMSTSILGETLDIHMGGVEHIPVHHTNEIAQSESATGKPFANYWLHNEWLVMEHGKISKSKGDSLSVDTVIERGFDPLDVRYLFLQAHYRSKQTFSWDALSAARTARENFIKRLISVAKRLPEGEEVHGELLQQWDRKFLDAIEDDVNVPKALAIAWDLVKSDEAPADILATIFEWDRVFGLKLEEAVLNASLDEGGASVEDVPAEVLELVKKRRVARQNKDFRLADELRAQVAEMGYRIVDVADGELVKPA